MRPSIDDAAIPAGENMIIRLLPRRRHGILLRYAASTIIVLVTGLVRFSLENPLQNFPILLFFPAVFLCALMFDRGSGFYATLLSAAIAAYVFIPPAFSFRIGVDSAIALAIFVLIGFTMSLVTEALRRTVTRLDESERATTLLLEELAHRTKNDLAIISSALQLQSRASDNAEVQAALEAANARVLVVARAQERLRGDRDGGLVDLADYLTSLCQGLGDLLRDVRPIAVRVFCAPLQVPSSTAVQIGLIVNELVTNSLKYAYPGERGGIVTVRVERDAQRMVVTVADDGVGCPGDAKAGLGTKLVRLLAKQLGGSVTSEPTEAGCRTRVVLSDLHA